MKEEALRKKAVALRQCGKTYSEICTVLSRNIPKSTLSYWCHKVPLTREQQNRIRRIILDNARKARKLALLKNISKRKEYFLSIIEKNKHLKSKLEDNGVKKLLLVALYWCEGGRCRRGSLMFANSDPLMIRFFLDLLEQCYGIENSKIRCTVECRYGQNTKQLENFWAKITKIPLKNFYSTRIDKRTEGKPLRKKNYKGVCRIDYFSAHIYNELMTIPKIITNEADI